MNGRSTPKGAPGMAVAAKAKSTPYSAALLPQHAQMLAASGITPEHASTDADIALAQRVSLAPLWVSYAVTDADTRGYARGYARGFEDRAALIHSEAAEVIGQLVSDRSLVWSDGGPRRRAGWSA